MMGLWGNRLAKLNGPISQSRREAFAGPSPFCLEVLSRSVMSTRTESILHDLHPFCHSDRANKAAPSALTWDSKTLTLPSLSVFQAGSNSVAGMKGLSEGWFTDYPIVFLLFCCFTLFFFVIWRLLQIFFQFNNSHIKTFSSFRGDFWFCTKFLL